MIEFSPLSQALAKEALAVEKPTGELCVIAITEPRKDDDIIGATLVVHAWLRRVKLVTIAKAAKNMRRDPLNPDANANLCWLKDSLLSGNKQSKDMVKLTDEAAKAANVWLDALD